jgi:hypothetical protein
MEYRLRRADGEYRWRLDNGVPRFAAAGVFDGYIGSCIDITERKLEEETGLVNFVSFWSRKQRLKSRHRCQ